MKDDSNSKTETLKLVKRSFAQYWVVLQFVSKFKGKIKVIDVGSQDDKLKKIVPPNVECKSLDMDGQGDYNCDLNKRKIPVKAKTFDVTVCLETLEHVLYPNKVIDELIRVTKDNGFLIISMPNEYNFWQRLIHLFGIKRDIIEINLEVVEKLGHIHKPRVCDIINLLSKKVEILEVIPIWQSTTGKTSDFFYFLDLIIKPLAKIYPSLFSRLVVVIAKKK
ncbi:methyltransferase domain-containing protein [Candidatus Pacearchaeota archaeon]|nr:methyltransferase domain-containing protein [Candidatus Pacearchaeota archaeon]